MALKYLCLTHLLTRIFQAYTTLNIATELFSEHEKLVETELFFSWSLRIHFGASCGLVQRSLLVFTLHAKGNNLNIRANLATDRYCGRNILESSLERKKQR
jgi:hypothetical protein